MVISVSHILTRAMRDAVEETAFELCRYDPYPWPAARNKYKQTRDELYKLATVLVKETKGEHEPAMGYTARRLKEMEYERSGVGFGWHPY